MAEIVLYAKKSCTQCKKAITFLNKKGIPYQLKDIVHAPLPPPPPKKNPSKRQVSPLPASQPKIVIVGAGFGGLRCAQALADFPVDVTVIDRSNHHLFQPLLYQVATATLSPADIASPIRSVLADQPNAEVLMAEVVGIDKENRQVLCRTVDEPSTFSLPYDVLVI